MARPPHIHCELGPVLINRTGVYKICKVIPQALAERGFHVTCSALLSRLGMADVEPHGTREKSLFRLSHRWLHEAIRRPGLFTQLRHLTGWLPRWRHGGDVRLFLDPLYVLFYGSPQRRDVVMTYDITPVSDPAWHHKLVCVLYRRAYDLLARSACHIVTSCRNTADQLRAGWGIAPSRLTVLPLGLFPFPQPTAQARSTATAPFLLFVGTTEEPRKNVLGLIQGYAASGLSAARGIRLRIIGSHGGEDHPVVQAAQATPGVDLLGFASDQVLAESYASCLAFVYPSFCEGFGFPLLEAMARGCVCLATTLGASPEVAGAAALYVNPYSVEEIAQGLRRVVDLTPEERQVRQQQAQAQAALLTWDRFHDGLAGMLRNVLLAT